jgi:hypothetical protein
MRIGFVGVVVTLSICGMPLAASAQSACARPWAIADKWIDNHDETEPIDHTWTPDDTFDTVDAQGNPLLDADVYNPPGDPAYTGFSLAQDLGRPVWLKVGDSGVAKEGWVFPVDIGGAGGGGDAYRTAIATCDPAAPTTVHVGDVLPVLSGNLHGPTIQGAVDLISQDPTAWWNPDTDLITASCADNETPCAPFSPRLVAIAAFDPAELERSRRSPGALQLRVVNVVGVFVEGYINGYVIGRLTPLP